MKILKTSSCLIFLSFTTFCAASTSRLDVNTIQSIGPYDAGECKVSRWDSGNVQLTTSATIKLTLNTGEVFFGKSGGTFRSPKMFVNYNCPIYLERGVDGVQQFASLVNSINFGDISASGDSSGLKCTRKVLDFVADVNGVIGSYTVKDINTACP